MRTPDGIPPHGPVNPGLVHATAVELTPPLTAAVPVQVPPVAAGVLIVKAPLNVLVLTVPVTAPAHPSAPDTHVPVMPVPD